MKTKVIASLEEIRTIAEKYRNDGKIVALVPTMGALHEGHLSLVRIVRSRADVVVVSIFVNPAQFGPGEDLGKYPRTLDRDVEMLAEVGADYIFTPNDAMMYPAGYATYVTVEGITGGLCGKSRPGHFRGVATIVTKLFAIVRPHIAVFGQKDAQQLAVIRRMNADLNLGVEIIGAPIVREHDGLAMSSRNAYLKPEERSQAVVLSKALKKAESLVRDGVIDADTILDHVREVITHAPLAYIEYIELVDAESLTPLQNVNSPALLALAVRFGATRLIDNTFLNA